MSDKPIPRIPIPGLMIWHLPDEDGAVAVPEPDRAAIEEAIEFGVGAAFEWFESLPDPSERSDDLAWQMMGIATNAAAAAIGKYKQMKETSNANTTTGSAS